MLGLILAALLSYPKSGATRQRSWVQPAIPNSNRAVAGLPGTRSFGLIAPVRFERTQG